MHAPSWPSVGHETLLTFGCVFHRGLAWRIHIIAGGARWWSNRFSWNVMTDHAIRLCQPVLCGNLMRCGVCNGRVNCWYCDTDSIDGEARFLLLLKTALKFPSLACSQSIEGEEGGGGVERRQKQEGAGVGGRTLCVLDSLPYLHAVIFGLLRPFEGGLKWYLQFITVCVEGLKSVIPASRRQLKKKKKKKNNTSSSEKKKKTQEQEQEQQ